MNLPNTGRSRVPNAFQIHGQVMSLISIAVMVAVYLLVKRGW